MAVWWWLMACSTPDPESTDSPPAAQVEAGDGVSQGALDGAIDSLRAYVDAIDAALREELASQASTLADALAALADRQTTTEAATAALEGAQDAQDGRIADVEAGQTAVSADVAALDATVASLRGDLTDASRLTTGTLPVAQLPLQERTLNLNMRWSDERTSFIVPPDFAGTSLAIDLVWEIDATNCQAGYLENAYTYGRPGQVVYDQSGPSNLISGGGFTTVSRTARVPVRQTFTLSAPAALGSVQAGDAVHVWLGVMQGGSCEQQSADPSVIGAQLRYQGR